MSKITIFQPNGEVIERDMTPQELAQQAKDLEDYNNYKKAEKEKELAKAAAEAKLAALGITSEDLKVLGLG